MRSFVPLHLYFKCIKLVLYLSLSPTLAFTNLKNANIATVATAAVDIALSSSGGPLTLAEVSELELGTKLLFKIESSYSYVPKCVDVEVVTLLQVKGGTPPIHVEWPSGCVLAGCIGGQWSETGVKQG
jgi:hypothetical protein